jgi:hypothetical protein
LNAPMKQMGGARFHTVAAMRSAMCAEIALFCETTGRMPIARDIERWAGLTKNMGSYHAQRLRMHGLVTFEFGESLTIRAGKPTRSIFICLTDAGRAVAKKSSGLLDAPRKVVDGRTPREQPIKRKRQRDRLTPGHRHGTRVLVCVLDQEVMTRCVLCGFEATLALCAWGIGRPTVCRRCGDDTSSPPPPPEVAAAWADDTPDIASATREERDDLLDLVLEEIGASPFNESERMDLAIAYLAEHAPNQPLTLEQVAIVVGVTRERIRQVERNALDALRARMRRSGEADDIIESLREIDAHRVGEE